MSNEYWSIDDTTLQAINEANAMSKTVNERQEGLEILEKFPMTLPLLMESGVGRKITRTFKSSRFFDIAHRTHTKWLQDADNELQKNWMQLRERFLSKEQLAELDKAQAAFVKKREESLAAQMRPPASNQGLLQIASRTPQVPQKTLPVKRTVSAHRDDDYIYEQDLKPFSSSSGRRYTTGEPPRKRGRPPKVATNVVSSPLDHSATRRGGRIGKMPTRYLE